MLDNRKTNRSSKKEQFNLYSVLITIVHRNGIVLGSLSYPKSGKNNLLKELIYKLL